MVHVDAYYLEDEVMVLAMFSDETLVPFTYLEVREGDDINALTAGRALMASIAHAHKHSADGVVSA